MVHRPPTINARVVSVANLGAVRAMPGVTDVGVISTGVAVRAQTFGQCIDAIRAMDVDWNPGTVEGESDDTILAKVRKAELPLAVPKVPVLAKTIESDFIFMFRSSAALEPYSAVADVRADHATVWAGLKVPIVAQMDIAQAIGLPK
jgi:isoquinoline 1-oxidoreductase beta subunit